MRYDRRMPIRILAIGDIVGRPGRQVLHEKLPGLVREMKVDLVIANAENIAGGSGITVNLFNKIRRYGVDVVTLGDHVYRKNEIVETMNRSERIVRPRTCRATRPGRGYTVVQSSKGHQRRRDLACWAGSTCPAIAAGDPFDAIDRVTGRDAQRA